MNRVETECKYDKLVWVKHWVTEGFISLEKFLQDYKGKYCFGDELTLADAFFVP